MYTVTGLSPLNSGKENHRILQEAVNRGGEILVNTPGVFKLAGTVFIGDHTHLKFAPGVYWERESTGDLDGNAFLNSNALKREYNEDIWVEGLQLFVNGVERTPDNPNTIIGLRAHIAFMYVKDLVLRDITVRDLKTVDYAIQISDFENVTVENIRAEGMKDGIHFGPGRYFTLRHGVFRTFDDPIALNGSDYTISNPNLGWIEDGLIEDCYDLPQDSTWGFFVRMLGGAWRDWFAGMEVQHSDAVIHNGHLYRVKMEANGKTYISNTPPTHTEGACVLDGINWVRTQNDLPYTGGCRNITVRNCWLQKNREFAAAIYMDKSEFLRSYYPNSQLPIHTGIVFENIHFQADVQNFIWINAPLTDLTIQNCHGEDINLVFEQLDTEGLVYPPVRLRMEDSSIGIINRNNTEIGIF